MDRKGVQPNLLKIEPPPPPPPPPITPKRQPINPLQAEKEKKLLKQAGKVTAKGVLQNIFANKARASPNVRGLVIDDDTNNKDSKLFKKAKNISMQRPVYDYGDRKSQRPLNAQTFAGDSLEVGGKNDGIEENADDDDDDNIVERLIEEKDKTIELMADTNQMNTTALENQFIKATDILENAMRDDRNAFSMFTERIEAIIREKDQAIEKLMQETNLNNAAMQEKFNIATTELQHTLNEDRAAFSNYSKQALEQKMASDIMIKTTMDTFKDTMDRTVAAFVNQQIESLKTEKNDAIKRMEELQTQYNATLQEQRDANFFQYHIRHSKQFAESLDAINTLHKTTQSNVETLKTSMKMINFANLQQLAVSYNETFNTLQQTLQNNTRSIETINASMIQSNTNLEIEWTKLNARLAQTHTDAISAKFPDLTNQLSQTNAKLMGSILELERNITSHINSLRK